MSYNAKTKPRYKTSEKLSHYLGQWGDYDLYFDSGCCIARNGDEPNEYLAGPWRVYAEQALNGRPYLDGNHKSATLECFFRAYRNNILPKLAELRQCNVGCRDTPKSSTVRDAMRWEIAKGIYNIDEQAIDSHLKQKQTKGTKW